MRIRKGITLAYRRVDFGELDSRNQPAVAGVISDAVGPANAVLLLDAIEPDGPSGNRYKHDFAFLNAFARRLSVTRPPDECRIFILFEVVA